MGALDRGYGLTLTKDADTPDTIELENGIRIEAENIIRELNIAMTWLSYTGRTNSTASVEEVDFSVPGGVRQTEPGIGAKAIAAQPPKPSRN